MAVTSTSGGGQCCCCWHASPTTTVTHPDQEGKWGRKRAILLKWEICINWKPLAFTPQPARGQVRRPALVDWDRSCASSKKCIILWRMFRKTMVTFHYFQLVLCTYHRNVFVKIAQRFHAPSIEFFCMWNAHNLETPPQAKECFLTVNILSCETLFSPFHVWNANPNCIPNGKGLW